MPPSHIRLAGGATTTILSPIVFVAMVLAIILILFLPRKYTVVPFLLISMLTPWGQTLVVGGFHLTVVRIVVLFAWVKIVALTLTSRLRPAGGLTSIDTAFSLWAFCYAGAFILLYWELPALINRCGFLLDAVAVYFIFRYLVQDDEDVRRVLKTLAYIAAIVAISMLNEQFTHRDLFGLLGGVPQFIEFRHGLFRSHAVFQHPILAGTFGATILPLFIGLKRQLHSNTAAIIGIVSAIVIVVTSSSSTPLLTLVAVIAAICLWPIRTHMRMVRWGIVVGIIALQLLMKVPVWWAIAHVHVAGGSSWDRANLINNFVIHFHDWWLIGAKNYANWGWDMWDTSNEYVAMGVNGGLAGLVAFIAMISYGFGKLGSARKMAASDRRHEWFIWCMGCALFGHVVAFIGISYWDQTEVAWFALLAMISTSSFMAMRAPAAQQVTQPQGGPLFSVGRPGPYWTSGTSRSSAFRKS